MTAPKEAEEALRAAKEAAEDANRHKSEFISTVTHELRTPLSSVKGYLEVLIDGMVGDLNQDQRNFLEIAQRNANRLIALVNDVLDLSRIEAGGMNMRLRPVEMAEAVRQVRATLLPQADAKHLWLAVDVPEGLPPVLADADRWHQVLVNLVGNAVKFTEHGGVTVSVRRDGDVAVIAVDDTGIGIEPDALTYVFEEFRQADSSSTRKHGGTGLGLAIAKKLVGLMHGTIELTSQEGLGTTVTVRLPIAAEPVTAGPALGKLA